VFFFSSSLGEIDREKIGTATGRAQRANKMRYDCQRKSTRKNIRTTVEKKWQVSLPIIFFFPAQRTAIV
jgi:hypothetical protein